MQGPTIARSEMPRPRKTFRRIKIQAAAAWKTGDKKEAYKLWEKAAAGVREHRLAKHNKKKEADTTDQSKEASAPEQASE